MLEFSDIMRQTVSLALELPAQLRLATYNQQINVWLMKYVHVNVNLFR